MRILKKQPKKTSIIITLLISFSLGFLSIFTFKQYGWLVFVFLPFLLGFLPVYLTGTTKKITKKESISLGFTTLGFALLALLVFALEGIICIIMALPLFVIVTWLGSYIGYQIHARKWNNTKNTTFVLLVVACGFMGFDYQKAPQKLIPVSTKIQVNAPIDSAWKNVITFDRMAPVKDWIFKTGIAYPTHATIQGKGVGAVRYCSFTTGDFVEPITTWQAPTLLEFDVLKQPIAMEEFNPFWDIHPPHLDGYFTSYKGQFKLTSISPTKTQIEGTTWYKVAIYPAFYWQAWTGFILHRIHKRVLKHIKISAEQSIQK